MTDKESVDFINACGDKMNAAAPLTELEKIAALVSAVDFEIALGGLAGFYYNSAGNSALETVAALETIGANEAAEALARSIQTFPNPEKISERDFRQDCLASITTDFRKAEASYHIQAPCAWELLIAYVKENCGE